MAGECNKNIKAANVRSKGFQSFQEKADNDPRNTHMLA